MTTTTLINGQSFGTGSNVGPHSFSVSPTTIQSTTTAFVINVKVVLGSGQKLSQTTKVRVWYTTCVDTVTSVLAPEQLESTAHFVDVVLDRNTKFEDSMLEPVTGTKVYCWVDAPTLEVASTVTAKLIELP